MNSVGVLVFALLVAVSVSLTTAQDSCSAHNSGCDACFGANTVSVHGRGVCFISIELYHAAG